MGCNREKIINALTHCSRYYGISTCGTCPKWTEREFYKPCDITKETLALVNELIQENESLSQSYTNLKREFEQYKKHHYDAEFFEVKDKIKADTVRKMQERIKAEKFHHKNFGDLVYLADIDQIAKEMLEDKK